MTFPIWGQCPGRLRLCTFGFDGRHRKKEAYPIRELAHEPGPYDVSRKKLFMAIGDKKARKADYQNSLPAIDCLARVRRLCDTGARKIKAKKRVLDKMTSLYPLATNGRARKAGILSGWGAFHCVHEVSRAITVRLLCLMSRLPVVSVPEKVCEVA